MRRVGRGGGDEGRVEREIIEQGVNLLDVSPGCVFSWFKGLSWMMDTT